MLSVEAGRVESHVSPCDMLPGMSDARVSPGPPPTNTARILDRAFALLQEAAPQPGHLLDLPCGSGYLAHIAAEAGWQVTAADLIPAMWQGPADRPPTQADLNGRLPFGDDFCDAIACCEGMEHIENPWLVLREFHRILRPGGQLVVSLPNTVDLRQRFRMLRRGYWGHYFPRVPSHINHMGAFVLCHALLRTGFAIRDIRVAKVYGGLPYRLLAPLFRYTPKCGLPPDVCAMLSRPEVLCGRTVIVRATAEAA